MLIPYEPGGQKDGGTYETKVLNRLLGGSGWKD
jgi:hypothetical protein